jgi:hypothetical protein
VVGVRGFAGEISIRFTDFECEVNDDSKSDIFRRCDSPSKLHTSVSLENHPIPERRMIVGIDHEGTADAAACTSLM